MPIPAQSMVTCPVPSRRQLLSTLAAAGGGWALGVTAVGAQGDAGISRAAEAIHQEPVIHAPAARVYAALTEARQFNEVTKIVAAKEPTIVLEKSPTVISPEVGGTFSLFGGIIVGRHLEFVPGARLVQAWRVAYWAPGAYSIVRFELVAHGVTTRIVFDHTGFPKGDADSLASGWKAHYWEPLETYLTRSPSRP